MPRFQWPPAQSPILRICAGVPCDSARVDPEGGVAPCGKVTLTCSESADSTPSLTATTQYSYTRGVCGVRCEEVVVIPMAPFTPFGLAVSFSV